MFRKNPFSIILFLLIAALLAGCTGVLAQTDGQSGEPGAVATQVIYPSPKNPDMPVQSEPLTPGKIQTGGPENDMRPPVDDLAATGQPLSLGNGPWNPLHNDDQMLKGQAFLDNAHVLTLESFPPKYRLSIQGNLPTPCYKLRVRLDKVESNNIYIEVYSVVSPEAICAQVLEPFDASIPLLGLPSGISIVWVNGAQVATVTK